MAGYALLQDGKPAEALKAVTALKAVGPATASALLSLWAPQTQAFMSDEVVEALGGTKGDYTVKGWTAHAERVRKACVDWDGGAEDLERACFALIAGRRFEDVDEERPKKKRKR